LKKSHISLQELEEFVRKKLKDMSAVLFVIATFKDFFMDCWKYSTNIHKQLIKCGTYHEHTSVKLWKMLE